jgi:hypothetical protein
MASTTSRGVFGEQILFQRPGEECVVDAKHDIGDGVPGRERCLGDHPTGVASGQHRHLDPGLVGECSEGLIGHGVGKRVMSDESQFIGGLCRFAAARRDDQGKPEEGCRRFPH